MKQGKYIKDEKTGKVIRREIHDDDGHVLETVRLTERMQFVNDARVVVVEVTEKGNIALGTYRKGNDGEPLDPASIHMTPESAKMLHAALVEAMLRAKVKGGVSYGVYDARMNL